MLASVRKLMICAPLVLAGSALWAAPTYRITDLGVLPDGPNTSYATAVNRFGAVVGAAAQYADNKTIDIATLWDPVAGTIEIGLMQPEDLSSAATGINTNGQVVGISGRGFHEKAFMWTLVGGMEDLGSFSKTRPRTNAISINEAGDVAGYSLVRDDVFHAFLWRRGIGLIDIGTLPIGHPNRSNAFGFCINDLGQIVGQSNGHAFFWSELTGMIDLGTLHRDRSSMARSINNRGQVVGFSWGLAMRPFIWSAAAGKKAMGTFDGLNTQASSINAFGKVVGSAGLNDQVFAVYWDKPSMPVNLNDLVDSADPLKSIALLQDARSINDSGEVAASGLIAGQRHAFLLKPIP
jgi:probable HAF family extracellular repeat protein